MLLYVLNLSTPSRSFNTVSSEYFHVFLVGWIALLVGSISMSHPNFTNFQYFCSNGNNMLIYFTVLLPIKSHAPIMAQSRIAHHICQHHETCTTHV